MRRWFPLIAALIAAVQAAAATSKPMIDSPSKTVATEERITFGGGCFWCLEAVFQRLVGVTKVVSGYAGGKVANPTYESVCTGDTGHAEVVQLTFDPTKVSYEKLLKVFWAAHDPTSVLEEDAFKHGKLYPKGTAYQGADVGSQYRSIILFETPAQKAAAETSKAEAQKEFKKPIATEIVPLQKFYAAEDYHQNYYNQNKSRNSYCGYVITPKLEKLLKKGLIAEEPFLK
ncbi:MAG: peptide-methionine (S)-S-oxide reductase MsrA [Verrucomicrobiales bacterium]|nr:peptide-methionine (S)-S-oxide reductase MsrA [Verrucomicrobiales bacterium]